MARARKTTKSSRPATAKTSAKSAAKSLPRRPAPGRKSANRMPARPMAQLATLVTAAPPGDDWLHELKFDGYRLLARLERGRAELWTRNGNDWTDRFPGIAAAVEALSEADALLDGEVVIQKPDGTTSFQSLQNLRTAAGELLYYVFDLLYLDGEDLTLRTQEERKDVLLQLVGAAPSGSPVRYSDHVVGNGEAFFRQACRAGVEGIISKRRSAPYRSGRSKDWLKVKCTREQEFVIAGFTDPGGSRQDLGALLLAVQAPEGLRFSGKVGTGFGAETLRLLRKKLKPLERKTTALVNPPRGASARGVHWVEPVLVAQVSFTEMTDEGILRHPSFKGLREDKAAADVVLERPAPSPPPGGPAPPVVRVGRSGKREVTVAGVRLTSPEKVFYREEGYTKLDLARYYEAVADRMLPHLRERPLTLVRCPQGYEADCFFQKHMDEVDSPHVRKIRVRETRGARDYGTVRDLAGILTVVQLGALELHTWNSRADRLEQPDRVTLDIDPDPGVGWKDVVQAAREIRLLLRELDLECFLKTTGGKGLHVVVPLVRRAGWEDVRDFARAVLGTLAGASPSRYTLDMAKSKRKGRLLLDYLRNARGATAVEVYSTRARAGATVSTPISWEELDAGVDPKGFTIRTVPARLEMPDPWKDYGAVKQSLTAPLLRRLGLR